MWGSCYFLKFEKMAFINSCNEYLLTFFTLILQLCYHLQVKSFLKRGNKSSKGSHVKNSRADVGV